jgi:hypothetical protein
VYNIYIIYQVVYQPWLHSKFASLDFYFAVCFIFLSKQMMAYLQHLLYSGCFQTIYHTKLCLGLPLSWESNQFLLLKNQSYSMSTFSIYELPYIIHT